MKSAFAITIFLGVAFLAPTRAIMCVTCDECSNPSTIHVNKTCLSTEDTCQKLDFGKHIFKKCGTKATMCTHENFKTNSPTTWNKIQAAVGYTQAEAELMSGINAEGRTVLNCCHNMDYCNNGMQACLSLVAVFGILMTYIAA